MTILRRSTYLRTSSVAAGLVLAATVSLAGCGDSDPEPGAGDATTPGCPGATAPAIELSGPLAAFDLTGVAEPIGQSEEDGYLVANAVAEGEISDLVIEFVDVVEQAGFDLAGSENEEFEGEVFFATGDVAAGEILLREGDCEGVANITIELLDDPAVVPSST